MTKLHSIHWKSNRNVINSTVQKNTSEDSWKLD